MSVLYPFTNFSCLLRLSTTFKVLNILLWSRSHSLQHFREVEFSENCSTVSYSFLFNIQLLYKSLKLGKLLHYRTDRKILMISKHLKLIDKTDWHSLYKKHSPMPLSQHKVLYFKRPFLTQAFLLSPGPRQHLSSVVSSTFFDIQV